MNTSSPASLSPALTASALAPAAVPRTCPVSPFSEQDLQQVLVSSRFRTLVNDGDPVLKQIYGLLNHDLLAAIDLKIYEPYQEAVLHQAVVRQLQDSKEAVALIASLPFRPTGAPRLTPVAARQAGAAKSSLSEPSAALLGLQDAAADRMQAFYTAFDISPAPKRVRP